MAFDEWGGVSPYAAGLACRCPRCGQGPLYDGYLTVRESCPVCRLDLQAQDSGDGAAFFIMLAVGALAMVLWFVVESAVELSPLLHLLYLIPLVLGLSVVLLRPVKAVLIALQYRHRAAGFDS